MMQNLLFSSDSSSDEENVPQRLRKLYRKRLSYGWLENRPFDANTRFRMSEEKFTSLERILRNDLEQSTRGGGLTGKQIMEVSLHWLGTGVQYHAVGDMHGVSAATVHRCIHKFVKAVLKRIYPSHIKFPENMQLVAQNFHRIANMPQVCGAVDGTLIKIDAPTENEADFVDRHGNHSINCMAVCGPDMQFYAIDAHWPGSTHDSRVLRNSNLFNEFENGRIPLPGGILLGDSAYPLRRWLIPPVIRPIRTDAENIAQQRFLRSHKSTRRVIECAFGILKEKFPCLYHLHVNPIFAARIFKCCAALCNFIRTGQEDIERLEPFLENEEPDENLPEPDNAVFRNDEAGREMAENRFQEIRQYFM